MLKASIMIITTVLLMVLALGAFIVYSTKDWLDDDGNDFGSMI